MCCILQMHGKPKRLRRKKTGASLDAPVLVNKNGDRMESYLQNFRWADDKYPVSTPLREMVDEIVQVSSWHRCSNALFLPTRKAVVAAVGLPVICLGLETHLHALSSVCYLEASNESREPGRNVFVHPVVALPSVQFQQTLSPPLSFQHRFRGFRHRR